MQIDVGGVITQAALELGIVLMSVIAAGVIFVVASIAYSWFARGISDRSERAEYRRASEELDRMVAESGATYSHEHGWQFPEQRD